MRIVCSRNPSKETKAQQFLDHICKPCVSGNPLGLSGISEFTAQLAGQGPARNGEETIWEKEAVLAIGARDAGDENWNDP